MNDPTAHDPDNDWPAISARSQAVPAEVEARLRQRFAEFRGRVVSQRRLCWERLLPGLHPLRWAVGVAGTAAVVIAALAWLGPRSGAWAQVAKQLESVPWIHARGLLRGQTADFWFSVPQGIWAARIGEADFVAFANRESKLKQFYRSADHSIIRFPTTRHDEEELRQIDVLFAREFKGTAGADLSTSIERLVKQQKTEVEVDGKRWLDFELTFRAVTGDRERVVIYRVDPVSQLPKSSVEKPQFVDDPETRLEFDYPRSGPADIFALGVPRDAKVVDNVPGPQVEQILAGMRSGREKMDAYSGLIVTGSTLEDWFDASIVWRVWRNGNKWRIEQCDLPGPAWRDVLGRDLPSRSANHADQQAWWKKTAEKLRFHPLLVSDGKTSYRFKIKFDLERIGSRENWEKQRFEVESVAPDYIATPTSDVGPTTELLPEYVARPPVGIPSESRQAKIDPTPNIGPKGTVLLSIRSNNKSARSAGQRVWVDPQRGYIAMRQELESVLDGNGNPLNSVWVIDDAVQSPSGVWYPRVARSASNQKIGQEIGKEPAGITRYYLDFKTPIPAEVFATPTQKQPDAKGAAAAKPQTRAELRQRALSMINLRAIGVAMSSYEAEHHHFPSANVIGPDGKTPQSWRVALLPYLGYKELFDRYKLTETWDSENNRKILHEMPAEYRAIDDPKSTYPGYFLVTGKTTLFPPDKTLSINNIVDGAANTLLAVEAKRDIPWTKPEDLSYAADKLLPELGGFDPDGFCVVFADTSACFIERSKLDDATIRAWITPAGKEKVKRPDWLFGF